MAGLVPAPAVLAAATVTVDADAAVVVVVVAELLAAVAVLDTTAVVAAAATVVAVLLLLPLPPSSLWSSDMAARSQRFLAEPPILLVGDLMPALLDMADLSRWLAMPGGDLEPRM